MQQTVRTHKIYSHIFLHLKKYDLLCEQQHEFRAKRSCETPTINDIAVNLDEGKQTDVILLDFSKAFDRVTHIRICASVISYLIWVKRGHVYVLYCSNELNAFLSDRMQHVKVNGERSLHSRVISGVPQGSMLGLLLFLCYINDITSGISSAIKLYTDDVLIYE